MSFFLYHSFILLLKKLSPPGEGTSDHFPGEDKAVDPRVV